MDSYIAKLIGITEQQFEILKAIDAASLTGESKPKSIVLAYQKITGKPIQKPNLFTQLKELQKIDIITKTGGSYGINKARLKQELLSKKQKLAAELNLCSSLATRLDSAFKYNSPQVVVKYIDSIDDYNKSVDEIKAANFILRAANISELSYPENLQRAISCKSQVDAVLSGCKSGKLKARYILTFGTHNIFSVALNTFKDKKKAYEAVRTAFNNLITLLDLPNLELRYCKTNIETIMLIEGDAIFRLTIPLRASASQFYGVILIDSEDVCKSYEEIFNRFWQQSVPLTKALIKKIANKKLKELRKLENG